jgi:hypothetical protein
VENFISALLISRIATVTCIHNTIICTYYFTSVMPQLNIQVLINKLCMIYSTKLACVTLILYPAFTPYTIIQILHAELSRLNNLFHLFWESILLYKIIGCISNSPHSENFAPCEWTVPGTTIFRLKFLFNRIYYSETIYFKFLYSNLKLFNLV